MSLLAHLSAPSARKRSFRAFRAVGAGGVALAATLVALTAAAPSGASSVVKLAPRPCDILAAAHTPCVAAYSSTRALFAKYHGPLYQIKRASDGKTKTIGVTTRGGYAKAAAQDAFCAATRCVISKLFDQTADHNNLIPEPPSGASYGNKTPHDPVVAYALPVTAGGHPVYGMKFDDTADSTGQAYRNHNKVGRGVALGSKPESAYAVFGGTFSGDGCCFDFGNSEPKGTDDGNGTMDALNFSRACFDACGPGEGPWVQTDLENGMFMTGRPTRYPSGITKAVLSGQIDAPAYTILVASHNGQFCCDATAANKAMPYPFVTAILNAPGNGRFELRGANATKRRLDTFYNGQTPPYAGYGPNKKEGGIILGSGGDQGVTNGEFFEGAMTRGVPPARAEAAVQADIASVGYRMRSK